MVVSAAPPAASSGASETGFEPMPPPSEPLSLAATLGRLGMWLLAAVGTFILIVGVVLGAVDEINAPPGDAGAPALECG